MDKLPDWIITWLWIKNPVLNRDNRQFMHARWIKDDSDKEVMLTHTIWMFPKLFPIMLLHQIHNCSTSQLSHPGWGSRFVSGYLGTTSVGNRLLEHNREAVIPAMCLAWVSALNFVPLSTSILRIGSVLSSDHDWLQLSFPLSTPLLPSLPFFSHPFLVLPSACISGGKNWGEGEEKENSLSPGPRTKWEKAQPSHLHSASGPLRSQLHTGVVFIPAKIQPQQHKYQYSTTPAKTSQLCFFPFLLPSFLSLAKWNNNNKLQILAQLSHMLIPSPCSWNPFTLWTCRPPTALRNNKVFPQISPLL